MSLKKRLDQTITQQGLVSTRSQAESYIRLGKVEVNGKVQKKPGHMVQITDKILLKTDTQYVSRAGHKLESIAEVFELNFKNKVVLDVGSSTGGFTDFALKRGAKKVIAVDVGTNQLHPSLRNNPKIELHEQTDIRNFNDSALKIVDYVLIDASFISLRDILPHIGKVVGKDTLIVAMVKPQFEATSQDLKHKGVIKNESMRRDILKDFETWAKNTFRVISKADSQVAGEKGNRERFYLLAKLDT